MSIGNNHHFLGPCPSQKWRFFFEWVESEDCKWKFPYIRASFEEKINIKSKTPRYLLHQANLAGLTYTYIGFCFVVDSHG